MATKKTSQRVFQGVVVSAKMKKTVIVRIDRMKTNEKYGKQYRASTKFHVHDEKGEYKVGDIVRFVETRPLSKTKRWRAVEKVTLK
ncbi:MAG TPA: 30S ribosomal protein S17 [Candidatus Eisenbacteria bacterium]|jgi:small subunit ribosomal protein S17|nr:30S ribosomal protein S17 [Candidatus Eisenbacteria bacterium]